MAVRVRCNYLPLWLCMDVSRIHYFRFSPKCPNTWSGKDLEPTIVLVNPPTHPYQFCTVCKALFLDDAFLFGGQIIRIFLFYWYEFHCSPPQKKASIPLVECRPHKGNGTLTSPRVIGYPSIKCGLGLGSHDRSVCDGRKCIFLWLNMCDDLLTVQQPWTI